MLDCTTSFFVFDRSDVCTLMTVTVSYLCRVNRFGIYMLIRSISSNQRRDTASLGIRQSPRGERLTEPTLGPSGRQLRLNCCWKKRRKKV